MNPEVKKVCDLFEARNWAALYGELTPAEAIKSWQVEWTAPTAHRFLSWITNNRLNPLAAIAEVQVTAFNNAISWYTTALGAIRTLVRFNIITDIIASGVVYDGEEYSEVWSQDQTKLLRIEHFNTVDIRNKAIQPKLGYILIERPNGNVLLYKLTGQQLTDPKRYKPKNGNAWDTHRHEMFIKSMEKHACAKLMKFATDPRMALQFEHDGDQVAEENLNTPIAEQTETTAEQPNIPF